MGRRDGRRTRQLEASKRRVDDRWRFLRVLVPRSPLEVLELVLLVLGVGSGLLTIASAFGPVLGASPLQVALLGASGGVLTVAGAVVAVFRSDTMVVPTPPRRPGVHELPPIPDRFVGRRIWVARALRQLRHRQREAPILAITGMPGVGKTALALIAAHQLSSTDYPDNQFFIELGGRPVKTADDALREVLVKLGVPEGAIPADLDQRRAMLLDKLQGTRSLLVLDDATEAAQILRLRPPGGCAVIVTCRVELLQALAAGARPMRLRPLTILQALRFLTNRIGRWRVARQPIAALRLVRLLGRNPLALGCVSARLAAASGAQQPLVDVVRRLADPELRLVFASVGGDYSVMAALALSYEGLTPDQQRVLLLIGVLDVAEIDAEIVAAALGRREEQGVARALLGQLVDAGLLELAGPPGNRWLVHELVRAYARYRLKSLLRDPVTGPQMEAWCRAIIDLVVPVYLDRIQTLRDLEASPVMWLDPQRAAAKRAELERKRERAVALVDQAVSIGLDITTATLAELLDLLLEAVTAWPETPRAEEGVENLRRVAEQQQQLELERRAEEWLQHHRRPVPGIPPPAPEPASQGQRGHGPDGNRPEHRGSPEGDERPVGRHREARQQRDDRDGSHRDDWQQRDDRARARRDEWKHRDDRDWGHWHEGQDRTDRDGSHPHQRHYGHDRDRSRRDERQVGDDRDGPRPAAGDGSWSERTSPPPDASPPPAADGPKTPPPDPPGPSTGSGPPPPRGQPTPSTGAGTGPAPRPPDWPSPAGNRRAGTRVVQRAVDALYDSALRYEKHFDRGASWKLWARAARVRLWAARLRDPALLARVHRELGDQYQRRGQLETARRHYRASLELRRRLGDERGVAWMEDRLVGLSQPQKGPARDAGRDAATAPQTKPSDAGLKVSERERRPEARVAARVAAHDREPFPNAVSVAVTTPVDATPEAVGGPEAAPAWDVTQLGFDDEWLATSAREMAEELERLDESALRGMVSGLDRGLTSLERSFGARSVPVRPVRFGRW